MIFKNSPKEKIHDGSKKLFSFRFDGGNEPLEIGKLHLVLR
jgi:hypothetical protein